jgi:hypothetical protein
MSTGYVDQNLIQNSALACFLLTAFVKRYEVLTAKTASPELLKLLLVLPIVWHKESCDAIRNRNFTTSLQSVLAGSPIIRDQLQERIAEFSPISCQGLNLACASGLLRRVSIGDESCLSAAFDRWPLGSNPAIKAPKEMLQAIERLVVWFKDAQTAQLYSQLLRI